MTTPAPPQPTGRTTTQIRIPIPLWEYLWRLREPGETLAQALIRLLGYDKPDDDDAL